MAIVTQQIRFELAANEFVRIADMRDHRLACEAGEVWVTAVGDARDIVLRAGDSWRAETNAELAVSAFAASTLRLEYCQALGSVGAGSRGFLPSRRGWAFPPLAAFPTLLIR